MSAQIITFQAEARPKFQPSQRVRLVMQSRHGRPLIDEPPVVVLEGSPQEMKSGGWLWYFPEQVEVMPGFLTGAWFEADMEAADPNCAGTVVSIKDARCRRSQ